MNVSMTVSMTCKLPKKKEVECKLQESTQAFVTECDVQAAMLWASSGAVVWRWAKRETAMVSYTLMLTVMLILPIVFAENRDCSQPGNCLTVWSSMLLIVLLLLPMCIIIIVVVLLLLSSHPQTFHQENCRDSSMLPKNCGSEVNSLLLPLRWCAAQTLDFGVQVYASAGPGVLCNCVQ